MPPRYSARCSSGRILTVSLPTDFLKEQCSFLRRRSREWRSHIRRVRAFIGEALREAPQGRPVLILGAGSGLEIPWDEAPPGTTGWDLDPSSRLLTSLRWRRWPPWIFEDATGSLAGLRALALRSARRTGTEQLRDPKVGARRLAGLLQSHTPRPLALEAWLDRHRPGLVVDANWMGQLGVTAQRIIEQAFHGVSPWEEDPDIPDSLDQALDAWIRRILESHLSLLRDSGAGLCLVHDRAVIHGESPISLASGETDWLRQLRADTPLTLSDPLAGLDPMEVLGDINHWERWIWPVTPSQQHLIEALRRASKISSRLP
nr:hypothetical protein [uncultured Holophaga sp.]